MGIKGRLDRLERKMGLHRETIIVIERTVFGDDDRPGGFLDRETQIAQQRAEGKRMIIVEIPCE
jgi:hypothetical protein